MKSGRVILKHLKFLADIKFENPAHRIAFTEYRLAVQASGDRLERLNTVIRQESERWRWLPVVKPLMLLRGVDFLTAMTIVAEIGDLKRFDHPRKLMSFLGLVPCEFSSGASKQRGSITRTGNGRVRKLLIESAWNYQHPGKIIRAIEQRLDGLPKAMTEIA